MSDGVDITVTVLFHEEGALAAPALASLRDMVIVARAAGLSVEPRAILDRPDAVTRSMVASRRDWLDGVTEVSVGDCGLARNAIMDGARGRYLSFLDGDDLWGDVWLRDAFIAATSAGAPEEAIWHPEWIYYFDEGDFDRHSEGRLPRPEARSFFMHQRPGDEHAREPGVILLNNIWTANVFAPKALHTRLPYVGVDAAAGIGIEDWAWNMETLWRGIEHRIVPGAVHMVRQKESGSLGQRNTELGLLPSLPDTYRVGDWRPA
jgi:hypothetical protein